MNGCAFSNGLFDRKPCYNYLRDKYVFSHRNGLQNATSIVPSFKENINLEILPQLIDSIAKVSYLLNVLAQTEQEKGRSGLWDCL